MGKTYLSSNVYEASQERMKYIFNEFENVLVAFSGGKDSGVMLNLIIDYAYKTKQLSKVSVYHLDYEAQYEATTAYVTQTFLSLPDEVKKFWLCLPVSVRTATSAIDGKWIPWQSSKQEIWVRDMPTYPFVLNTRNCPFKFDEGEEDYTVQKHFCSYFAETFGNTTVAIGIRASESLDRFGAIKSSKKVNQYKTSNYITKESHNVFKSYIIYDWEVEDIWTANAKFGWEYNKLYDLYYLAGVPINKMRVASPFISEGIASLSLYKVIDPQTWAKMVGRVNGVNFAGIYGKTTAMGWKSIQLPPNHTWKTYLDFLLSTLPQQTRANYLDKFQTSIKFWKERGGVLSEDTIQELKSLGMDFEIAGKTNYKTEKQAVTFKEYPDDAPVTDFKEVPSYKRMCICIMKNDHLCKYMGFSQTKEETERRKKAIEKYKNLV